MSLDCTERGVSPVSAKEQTLEKFLSDLASSLPSPGGGGASALCGALAAALASMVGALTVGKKKYAAHEAELLALGRRAEDARAALLAMIDGDAAAFAPLSRAYSLPKDAPDREQILEQALREAADAPRRIAELCCEVIELTEGYAAIGSRLVLSDAATGAALARGALKGAVINVKVNTALMRDRAYADTLAAEMEEMEREYAARADAVCAAVGLSLGF